MNVRDKEHALKLCKKGLLVVSLTSARDYFSGDVHLDVPDYLPIDPSAFETIIPSSKRVPSIADKFAARQVETRALHGLESAERYFKSLRVIKSKPTRIIKVHVLNFTSNSRGSDAVVMAPWMFKQLGAIVGAPMVVRMPQQAGEQYFHNAEQIGLVPESELTLIKNLKETYSDLITLIRDSLSRYKVLMADTSIQLMVDDTILSFRVSAKDCKPRNL